MDAVEKQKWIDELNASIFKIDDADPNGEFPQVKQHLLDCIDYFDNVVVVGTNYGYANGKDNYIDANGALVDLPTLTEYLASKP